MVLYYILQYVKNYSPLFSGMYSLSTANTSFTLNFVFDYNFIVVLLIKMRPIKDFLSKRITNPIRMKTRLKKAFVK